MYTICQGWRWPVLQVQRFRCANLGHNDHSVVPLSVQRTRSFALRGAHTASGTKARACVQRQGEVDIRVRWRQRGRQPRRSYSIIVAPPSSNTPCLVASAASIPAAPEPSAAAAVAKPIMFATISNSTFIAPSSAIKLGSHHAPRTRTATIRSELSHPTRASGTNAIADSHPHTNSCRVMSCHNATNVKTQKMFRNHISVSHPPPSVFLIGVPPLPPTTSTKPQMLSQCTKITVFSVCLNVDGVILTAAHQAARICTEPTTD